MKKIAVLLILVMAVALVFTSVLADEVPQPEGGKKFEGNWALAGGRVQIFYEEEGYKVYLELYNSTDFSSTIWEYSCYYVEDRDVLESFTSLKYENKLDPETFDPIFSDYEYEGFDEEGKSTVFAINEEGKLTWTDGHGEAGQDLEFISIGNFEGAWSNEEEGVFVEISWEGLDENSFFYTVFIHRGDSDDSFVEFLMRGFYNTETKKLECMGSASVFTKNAEGGYDIAEDGESYDAFFSEMENGHILFETANGIELEQDFSQG